MKDKKIDVDALAQEIRRVDGKHSLGASALAEALMPFLSKAIEPVADYVTLESALLAIDHVEQHNGPGRAAQAREMLESVPQAIALK